MNKNLRKLLSITLVVMIVVAMAITSTGCGSKQETPQASTQETKKEAPKEEAKPVEITFSEQDDPNSVDPTWDEVIKEFMTANPTITVKRTHTETEGQRTDYQNAVAGGAGPEVISCPHDNIGVFGTAKTAMELDNFFSKEFYAQFSEKDINDYKLNGKIYGIPYKTGNCLALIYNKKLVAEAPKTMDELVAKAKELTKGTEQYGLVYDMVEPFFILPYLGGYGGKIFDDSGKLSLNTEAMGKLAKLVYDFKYTHKITPKEGNTDVANALFKEGKAAFIINGPWFYKQAADAGIDFGIAKIPELAGGTWPAPLTGAKVIMVNPNLKDENVKNAVKKFVEFINSAPIQVKLAKVTTEFPTNLEALKDPYVTGDEKMKALGEQMKVGTPMPYQPEMRAVWDSMRNVMGEVMGGKLKPEEAPKKMQDEADKIVKTMLGQ